MQNAAGQMSTASAHSVLISEWESAAYEAFDDDIDDGIPLVSIFSGVEKYRFSPGKIAVVNFFTKQRANIIRGPPSLT